MMCLYCGGVVAQMEVAGYRSELEDASSGYARGISALDLQIAEVSVSRF